MGASRHACGDHRTGRCDLSPAKKKGIALNSFAPSRICARDPICSARFSGFGVAWRMRCISFFKSEILYTSRRRSLRPATAKAPANCFASPH
jgi:hypothetical protein